MVFFSARGGFLLENRGVLIGGARAFSWGALEALFFGDFKVMDEWWCI